jgi:DNA-binding NarL/FixJ family response regulator
MASGAREGKRTASILIVDDHPLMREGLAARIGSQADMEVCGEAASLREALAKVKSTSPDLVIVDMALIGSHGIDLIKEIKSRFPNVRMLAVSAYDESLYAERALRAGAHGYLNKRECQEKVIDALRAVLNGQRYVSSEMTQRLLGQAIGDIESVDDPIQRLSNRELEVFQLIGRGQTTGAIARQLHLSVHTIETHREKLRHKLGLKNGVELTRSAIQFLLEQGPS